MVGFQGTGLETRSKHHATDSNGHTSSSGPNGGAASDQREANERVLPTRSAAQQIELIWAELEETPTSSASSLGPLVQFAQFDSTGVKVRLLRAHTKAIRFFAISHVWGDTAWRTVRCHNNDILTSASKARFIDERLFGLAGETPFWMDTVTINQRDQVEVINTVQAIPDIFKDAEKTIAITEGDGFKPCCADILHGFEDWDDFDHRLQPHFAESHGLSSRRDSYLRRLWTLQEVTLSHTIQFVAMPQEFLSEPLHTRPNDLLVYGEGWQRVRDALNSLSNAFVSRTYHSDNQPGHHSDARSVAFVRAYVEGGTVSSTKVLLRGATEDIFSDSFTRWFWASDRIATKPRDYVFATMPQFPWYQYPQKAEDLTFDQIFSDLAQKSSRAGHSFTGRFLQGMTGRVADGDSYEALWAPSSTQPEPECLGDFVKLLGHSEDSHLFGETTAVHFAAFAQVNVWPSQWEPSGRSCLNLIQSAIRLSSDLWTLSQRVGELSAYGSLLDPHDLEPFIHTDPREWWKYTMRSQPSSETATRRAIRGLVKVLYKFLGAVDKNQVNRPMQTEWRHFTQSMKDQWHPQMQHALLLMAAMISCRVPLSAFTWARQRFWPVTVALQDGTSCIGMVSWRYVFRLMSMTPPDEPETHEGRGAVVMIAAQHHTDAWLKGKDLVLVDPYTKIPIGILPDFTAEAALYASTEESQRAMTDGLTKLYGPLVSHAVDSSWSAIRCVPLDAVNIQPSARK